MDPWHFQLHQRDKINIHEAIKTSQNMLACAVGPCTSPSCSSPTPPCAACSPPQGAMYRTHPCSRDFVRGVPSVWYTLLLGVSIASFLLFSSDYTLSSQRDLAWPPYLRQHPKHFIWLYHALFFIIFHYLIGYLSFYIFNFDCLSLSVNSKPQEGDFGCSSSA